MSNNLGFQAIVDLCVQFATDEAFWENNFNVDYRQSILETTSSDLELKIQDIGIRPLNIFLFLAPHDRNLLELLQFFGEDPARENVITVIRLLNAYQKTIRTTYRNCEVFISNIPNHLLLLAQRNSIVKPYDEKIIRYLLFLLDPDNLTQLYFETLSDRRSFKLVASNSLTNEEKGILCALDSDTLLEITNSISLPRFQISGGRIKYLGTRVSPNYQGRLLFFKSEVTRNYLEEIDETTYGTTVEWFIISLSNCEDLENLSIAIAGDIDTGQSYLSRLSRRIHDRSIEYTELDFTYSPNEILNFINSLLGDENVIPVKLKFLSNIRNAPEVEIYSTSSVRPSIRHLEELQLLDLSDIRTLYKFTFSYQNKLITFEIKNMENNTYEIRMYGGGQRSNKIPFMNYVLLNYNIQMKESLS